MPDAGESTGGWGRLRSDRSAAFGALCVVLLHFALAWSWWGHQEFPRGFRDEFFIVELATDIAFGGDRAALVWGDYYPPGLRLPGVLALWGGGSYRSMLAAQGLLWVPLLAVGTWWAARRLTGPWSATAAVAMVLAASGVNDSLHRFEPNLGATAAGAACLAAFLWSDGLRSRRHVLLFAGSLAAGLMVDRLGTLPCVALPVAGAAWSGRRDPGVRNNLLLLVAVLGLLVGWWYAVFVQTYVVEWLPQLLHGEVGGDGELLEERPPGLLWLLHYLWLWPDSQVGLVLGATWLAALVVVRQHRDRDVRRTLLWLGLGLLVFTLIPKRQPFYTLPLLPAAAALAARFWGRWHLALPVAALATAPTALTSVPRALDLDPGVASWALLHENPLPESWVGQRFPLGQSPDERAIDVDALAALLAQEGVLPDSVVLAMSDDGVISESQLVSRLRISLRSARVRGVVLDEQGAADVAAEAAAFVDLHRVDRGFPDRAAVVAAYESRFGFGGQEPVVEAIEAQAPRARQLLHGRLPNGSWLTVWRLD